MSEKAGVRRIEAVPISAGRFAKNAGANIISGASSSVLALSVPPVLARFTTVDIFSTWSLVLQLASYTALLNLNVQTAVGRYIAEAAAKEDGEYASQIASVAFFILCGATLAAFLLIFLGCVGLPHIFPEIPQARIHDARLSLVLTGGALALGLPMGSINGVFFGLQRNDVVAWTIGGSRLITAVVLTGVAASGGGLVAMGASYAGIYCVCYFVQVVAFVKLVRGIVIRLHDFTRRAFAELVRYCSSLMIWTVAMLMVNGLDVALVGRFDFRATATYSSCLAAILILAGIQNALFSPLMQVVTTRMVQGHWEDIRQMLLQATRWSVLFLLFSASPLLLFDRTVLHVWLGSFYAVQGESFFWILVVSSMIRLIGTPYSVFLMATNRHQLVILGPIAEGATNLVVSVFAGYMYGATGVAVGTLVGAVVGQTFNLFYAFPKTPEIILSRRALFTGALISPFVSFLPVIFVFLLIHVVRTIQGDSRIIFTMGVTAFLISGLLTWFWAFRNEEKQMIVSIITRNKRFQTGC